MRIYLKLVVKFCFFCNSFIIHILYILHCKKLFLLYSFLQIMKLCTIKIFYKNVFENGTKFDFEITIRKFKLNQDKKLIVKNEMRIKN